MSVVLFSIFIYPITQIIELIFTFSLKVFKETGISILSVSVVLGLICLPFYNTAEKWQGIERNIVKRLKPQIDTIKAVFTGDERFMLLQTLYRQNNYHPVYALRSSLGILLQIPFFMAAYSCLSGLEILKGAHFLFISNLGAPDGLLSLGNIMINVLPISMTIINVVSCALYSKGFQLKDKIPLYGIALLFMVLLYNSPSALVIYWTMNNVFSLVKNIYFKIPYKNKKKLLAFILCICMLYLSFHLMVLYHGSYFLRVLISTVCVFASIAILLMILFRNFINNVLSNLFSRYFNHNNFLLFIFSFFTLCVLAGIYLPSSVIDSSPQEFSYIDGYTTPLYFIANTFLQAAGFFIFWPIFFYFFIVEYQKYFSFLGAILLFCALVNVFVFPGSYGIISLQLVFDEEAGHVLPDIAFNLAVLLLPTLTIILLYRLKREKIIVTAAILCLVSISFLSAKNILTIDREFREVSKYKDTASSTDDVEKDPFFYLSQTGKNTVVIMLDRAVNVFIPLIMDEDPQLKYMYSGFTYYPNTVSFNNYTSIGSPPVFGGYEYTPLEINRRDTELLVTKHNEALLLMPHIFSQAGFNVTVTDPPYPNYSRGDDLSIYEPYKGVNAVITDSKYTKLWLNEHDIKSTSIGDILKRNLLWYSLFRISPIALRQGIYLQGDYCSPNLMNKLTLTLNGYAVLDYLPSLTGISAENKNTALIMVNNTTHEPSFLQAPDYRPDSVVTDFGPGPFNKETAYHVNIASIKRLGEWLDFLKAQNVYDNTRIIIVSDHGAAPNFLIKTPLPFNVEFFNPLLLIKDFNAEGPINTDYSFMSNADVPFIALEGQIENPVNPFTGNKITTDMKLKPLYITISGSIHIEKASTKFSIDPKQDYYVQSNIFDPNNWQKAE